MSINTIYNQLAEIRGVGYQTPPELDRRSLPYRDLKPKYSRCSVDGSTTVYTIWEIEKGVISSQSPASAWAISGTPNVPWRESLKRLFEALELPGEASDYHNAIWRMADEFWDRRRKEPDVLPEIERLCLLDLRLMESLPGLARATAENAPLMIYISAFKHLIRLYEREGFIAEALDIARRGVALGLEPSEMQRLETRLKDLEAEDAA